jgi:GntR family transcriptional repressor for pyruvate dehydrogenase complex
MQRPSNSTHSRLKSKIKSKLVTDAALDQNASHKASRIKLAPIVTPKSSDILAKELRRQILGGTLPPGSALPAESDLVTQTGLSRGSVRDALRILESQSLLVTRPGRYGGSVAKLPDEESLGRSISIFVQGRGISLISLLQTREAIEPPMAAMAAKFRTPAELQELVLATERVEAAFSETPQFLRENVEWHMAIAAASHNELLRGFMHSLANMIYKVSAIDNFASEDVRKKVLHAHRRILDAITAQDEKVAERRMAQHLAAVTEATGDFPSAPLVLDL